MAWPDPELSPWLPAWLKRRGRAVFYSAVGGAAVVMAGLWLARVTG